MIREETVGWHHQLNGHESEQTPGDSGQGGLACHSPWGCRESDKTEQLNNLITKYVLQRIERKIEEER